MISISRSIKITKQDHPYRICICDGSSPQTSSCAPEAAFARVRLRNILQGFELSPPTAWGAGRQIRQSLPLSPVCGLISDACSCKRPSFLIFSMVCLRKPNTIPNDLFVTNSIPQKCRPWDYPWARRLFISYKR